MPGFDSALAGIDPKRSRALWETTFGDPQQLDPTCSYRPRPVLESQPLEATGFELGTRIGRGGMGEVFRARQLELERDVAFKTLHTRPTGKHAQAAFVAEAVVVGRLEHPNIVPIYALGERQGMPFMAMKLVGGTTWKSLLGRGGRELRAQLEILMQVCNAVAFAHSRSIIHNDLKPSNVMVGEFGEVIVLDWGLAVEIGETSDPTSRLRHKSHIRQPCGTPHYMPPELALGLGDCLGPWTDVYLLGASLFEILTGKPPHAADNVAQALELAARGAPPELPGDVPDVLKRICQRALAPLPRRRHASAIDFRDELAAFLRHAESFQLSERAETKLAQVRQHTQAADEAERHVLYQDFAECVAGFKQAREVWQGNPQAQAGERRAREGFAEAALQHGDLGLALVQVRALAELGDTDKVLEERVAAASRTRERTRLAAQRLRWGLRIAALVSLAAMLAVSAVLVLWNRAAERQRLRADRLVGAMLFEVYDSLQVIERLDLLERAAESVRSYYTELPLSDASDDELLLRAAVQSRSAVIFAHSARPAEALLRYQEAIEPLRRLLQRNPGRGEAYLSLQEVLTRIGTMHSNHNQFDQAHAALTHALACADSAEALGVQANVAVQHQKLGDLLLAQGQPEAALPHFEQSYAAYEKLQYSGPGAVTSHQYCQFVLRLASVAAGRGDFAEAEEVLRNGLALCETGYATSPHKLSFASVLSDTWDQLGDLLLAQGLLEKARIAAAESLARRQRMLADHPGVAGLQGDLLRGYNLLGRVCEAGSDLEGARQAFAHTIRIATELYAQDGSNAQWPRDLSVGLDDLARVLRAERRFEEALAASQQALEVSLELHARDPGNNPALFGLHWTRFFWVGYCAGLLGDHKRAAEVFAEGFETLHFPYLGLWASAFHKDARLLATTQGLPPWPQALVDYYRGALDADALLALARSPDPLIERQQLCEAYGYIGLWEDLQGNSMRACEQYRRCVATDVREFYELSWAEARLAQLEAR